MHSSRERSGIRAALVAGVCILVVMMGNLWAGDPSAKATSLAGTWKLRAAEVIRPDGTRVTDESYGLQAQGVLMIDAEGRYSLQIFRPDRPKFASGDKRHGTPAEYEAALMGMSTHVGHIVVDAANQTLIFKIDFAAYPNWDHTEQKRKFQLTGDELSYQVPAGAAGGTIAVSVWQRATPGQ